MQCKAADLSCIGKEVLNPCKITNEAPWALYAKSMWVMTNV